jgi:hypothetical protein
MATVAPIPRKKRRRGRHLSPRDLAYQELAAGTITQTELARRLQRLRNAECSSTWAEDIWEGKDRDYAAEAADGRPGVRMYTGSGTRKVRCARCRRETPPQNCTAGRVCDDCRLEDASQFFLEHLPGSRHRTLIGGER